MFGRDLKHGNKYLAGGVPVPLLTAHKAENTDLVLLGHKIQIIRIKGRKSVTSEEFTHRLEIHSNGQSQIKLTCLNEDVGKSRMRMRICCNPRGKAPGGKM